jgi:hypothetical protein
MQSVAILGFGDVLGVPAPRRYSGVCRYLIAFPSEPNARGCDRTEALDEYGSRKAAFAVVPWGNNSAYHAGKFMGLVENRKRQNVCWNPGGMPTILVQKKGAPQCGDRRASPTSGRRALSCLIRTATPPAGLVAGSLQLLRRRRFLSACPPTGTPPASIPSTAVPACRFLRPRACGLSALGSPGLLFSGPLSCGSPSCDRLPFCG